MNQQYNNRKVTYIEELPELDDLGSMSSNDNNNSMNMQNMIPSEYADKYQKVIRNQHIPSPESGMYYQQNYQQTQKIPSNMNKNIENFYRPPQISQNIIEPINNSQSQIQPHGIIQENFTTISCLDVANHIKSCPLCSKFYNNDKTFYIIAIVVLSLICILLLKKVLNM